jgi:hypothetical protein
MRPPWASQTTTTTSTTTTNRPWTQRTTSSNPLYPSWPPPLPTHPPDHTAATHPANLQWWQPSTQATLTSTTSPPNQWTQQPQQWWTQATRQTAQPTLPSFPVTTTPQTPPPSSSSCGFTKIVGGIQATKGEFPWLVSSL